jgi:hypothetical protein
MKNLSHLWRVTTFCFILILTGLAAAYVAGAAIQIFKDEAGRVIYTIDDEGVVSMFENSPGIDITLSVTRGTREQMQPQVTNVTPASVAAGSSVILKLSGKNLVGATVKFDPAGIESGSFVARPTSLEIPIRVPPTLPPGNVSIEVTTPIGSTRAAFTTTDLKIGSGSKKQDDRAKANIPTTAPSSCAEGMIGVSAESGGFCIDIDETFISEFRKAEKACAMNGKRLCQALEWRHACEQATREGLPLKKMLGNWEWTGSWTAALRGDFDDPMTRSILLGKEDCQNRFDLPQAERSTDVFSGRCCK